MSTNICRNFGGHLPEELELRLSSSLEDFIPEDETIFESDDKYQILYLTQKNNEEIYQNIQQLENKIKLLREQLNINNTLIFNNCPHQWVNDYYDPGSGRYSKACNNCGLSRNSRYKY